MHLPGGPNVKIFEALELHKYYKIHLITHINELQYKITRLNQAAAVVNLSLCGICAIM
jgi:hypothetical protein